VVLNRGVSRVDPALQVGLDDRNGVIGARVALTTVDPGLKSPYVHNWFAGVQRELRFGIVADLNYIGSAGRNLHNAYNIHRYTGDLIDGNAPSGSVKQSGWSQEEYLAGIFQVADVPTPADGQNGTLVRNAFRGPGYIDVSLSLSKRFNLTSRVNAEFRVDAFNAFNRVNLSDPNMDLSNANSGRSTSQVNTRAVQLGTRVRF
jgi:hypothetical protein